MEVLLVVVCVYLVGNKLKNNEIITLTREKLVVERGSNSSKEVKEYICLWTQIEIEKPIHPWHPLILVIASKGERVPIGDFLNEEEKLELIDRIEEIILHLRELENS